MAPLSVQRQLQDHNASEQLQQQHVQLPQEQQVQDGEAAAASLQAAAPAQQAADGSVRVTSRSRGQPGGSKRGAPGAASEGKRLKLNLGDEVDDGAAQYRWEGRVML